MLEYVAIALLIILSTVVALIAIGLGTIFGPKKESAAKSMPYESGMSPYGEGTRRMPIRFYLIAVLFILFDIEVVFFLPYWLGMYMPGRKERSNGSRAKTGEHGCGDDHP
jgi:NADH-quinone oxidoreductase subunit A